MPDKATTIFERLTYRLWSVFCKECEIKKSYIKMCRKHHRKSFIAWYRKKTRMEAKDGMWFNVDAIANLTFVDRLLIRWYQRKR